MQHRVVVTIAGGLVEQVSATDPAAVEVIILDRDVAAVGERLAAESQGILPLAARDPGLIAVLQDGE